MTLMRYFEPSDEAKQVPHDCPFSIASTTVLPSRFPLTTNQITLKTLDCNSYTGPFTLNNHHAEHGCQLVLNNEQKAVVRVKANHSNITSKPRGTNQYRTSGCSSFGIQCRALYDDGDGTWTNIDLWLSVSFNDCLSRMFIHQKQYLIDAWCFLLGNLDKAL